jgi:hypothetical protein
MDAQLPQRRHCERSEAIQTVSAAIVWIASSQELLAMTGVVNNAAKISHCDLGQR